MGVSEVGFTRASGQDDVSSGRQPPSNDYGACFAEERFPTVFSGSVVLVCLACSVAVPNARRKGSNRCVASCVQDGCESLVPWLLRIWHAL